MRCRWRISDVVPPRAAALAVALLLLARWPGLGVATDTITSSVLRRALTAPIETCQQVHLDGRQLARYYPAASLAPLWVDESGPLPRAGQLRAALERSEDEGLSLGRYGLAAIEAHWHATGSTELVCLDLLLTAAFERYVRDLGQGQLIPGEADRGWHLPERVVDPVAILRAASPDTDVARHLDTLSPSHGLYRRLRAALAKYRRLGEQGGWDTTLSGPTLRPGDEGARVVALRARLRHEGDLEPGAAAPGRRWDPALTDAVQRFQRRHGLLPDAIVGPRTLAALDIPVTERTAQLRRAMERLRWMPGDLGGHYVLVNTAGFELAVVEGDRTVLGMRVIVGTPEQATPSFTATLKSLVINPYWNVPVRIARDKLWPREQRNPGYLAARGFRVLDPRTGRWREPGAARLSESSPRLRQEPGSGNLMGRLSFVLPNPFDIFLHDTPDRSLFEREIRACSEGCLRIEHAMALALHTLRRAPEWTEERIQAEIDALRHRVLTLPEPIPVYVVYLPSWVDEDGLAHFRPDHYGREAGLAQHFPPR
jgi:murein L,D-transpeptidase YcbB/YkuD